jgi:hypothetical protein
VLSWVLSQFLMTAAARSRKKPKRFQVALLASIIDLGRELHKLTVLVAIAACTTIGLSLPFTGANLA